MAALRFSSIQLEALSRVICEELTMSEIERRLDDAGISRLPSAIPQTKWVWLTETLQITQDVTGGPDDILRLVSIVMKWVSYVKGEERRDSFCARLNPILFDSGYALGTDGTVSEMFPNF